MSQNVAISAERYEVNTEAPLTNFSHCHIGILHQIERLASLPDLLGPAMLAKRIATQSIEYFHHGMHAHHHRRLRAARQLVAALSRRLLHAISGARRRPPVAARRRSLPRSTRLVRRGLRGPARVPLRPARSACASTLR